MIAKKKSGLGKGAKICQIEAKDKRAAMCRFLFMVSTKHSTRNFIFKEIKDG